ncbi:hypothetical protein [Phycicoccus sp. Soil748]|uniref:hypothetical protein n=1 Tax=Phycicoccus sp. Soil748 TaxID=1736397 RepID=UPI000AB3478D|nr:hypothetical protein [Phycicoccus sp. Soil748]
MNTRPAAAVAVGAALALVAATPALAAVSPSPAPSSTATGPVYNSVQAGTRLYIGGSFTKVDSAAAAGLAALNATTGVRDPAFKADVVGKVYALATDGTTIFLGGSFTSVGGVARTNLAAVSPSGQVVSSFHPDVSSTVESLDYTNGTLYIGGAFSTVNGTKRPKLAALDPTTGAVVQSFNPKPNGLVHVVKASGSQVYVGGRFTSIGGAARSYVALLDASGVVQPYDPKLAFDSQVFDIATSATGVYLGTGGHLPAGNSVYGTTPGSGAQRWQVKTDGNVQSVEAQGSDIYGAGHFNNTCLPSSTASTGCLIDFSARKTVVVDDGTGVARAFATFNSAFGVWDLTTAGGNLYALGEFTKVNNTNQPGIARFPIP